MEQRNFTTIFMGALLSVVLVASIALVQVGKKSESLGTELSVNPSTDSYTDSGADWRQNLQAISEKMAGQTEGEILVADSQGRMQSVVPSTQDFTFGTVTTTGVNTDYVNNGGVLAVSTSSATYVLTAAQVCDNSLITFEPLGEILTVTFPSSTAVIANCSPSIGSSHILNVFNISETTSTILDGLAADGNLNLVAPTSTMAASTGGMGLIQTFTSSIVNAFLSL